MADVILGAGGSRERGWRQRAHRIDGPSLPSGSRTEQHPWPIHAVSVASMSHRCGLPPPGNRIDGTSLRPAQHYGPFVRQAPARGHLADAITKARKHKGRPVLIECQIAHDDCGTQPLEWGSKVARANARPHQAT